MDNNKYNVDYLDVFDNKISFYWENAGKDFIFQTLKNITELCNMMKIKCYCYAHNLNYDIGAVLEDKEKILTLEPIMSGSRLIEVRYPTNISEKYYTLKKKHRKKRDKIKSSCN